MTRKIGASPINSNVIRREKKRLLEPHQLRHYSERMPGHYNVSEHNRTGSGNYHQALPRCLVSLRSSGGRPPLFCVHPSGGDIGIYRKLARKIHRFHPVIAIESRMIGTDIEEFSSIELMSGYYEKLIEQYHPSGPIQLFGFSFGGFVATAIANRLHRSHREVSFLGLVDSDIRWIKANDMSRRELNIRLHQLSRKFQEIGIFNPTPDSKVETDVKEIVENCFESSEISPVDLMQDLQSRGYTNSENPHANLLCQFIARFLTHCKLLKNFDAGRIEVPMKLWWPTDPASDPISRRRAWQKHAVHEIEEYQLKGSHYSIMRMPTLNKLSGQINNSLLQSS